MPNKPLQELKANALSENNTAQQYDAIHAEYNRLRVAEPGKSETEVLNEALVNTCGDKAPEVAKDIAAHSDKFRVADAGKHLSQAKTALRDVKLDLPGPAGQRGSGQNLLNTRNSMRHPESGNYPMDPAQYQKTAANAQIENYKTLKTLEEWRDGTGKPPKNLSGEQKAAVVKAIDELQSMQADLADIKKSGRTSPEALTVKDLENAQDAHTIQASGWADEHIDASKKSGMPRDNTMKQIADEGRDTIHSESIPSDSPKSGNGKAATRNPFMNGTRDNPVRQPAVGRQATAADPAHPAGQASPPAADIPDVGRSMLKSWMNHGRVMYVNDENNQRVPVETLSPEDQAKLVKLSKVIDQEQERMGVRSDGVYVDKSRPENNYIANNPRDGGAHVGITLKALHEDDMGSEKTATLIRHELRHLKYGDAKAATTVSDAARLSNKMAALSDLMEKDPAAAQDYINRKFGSTENFEAYVKNADAALEPVNTALYKGNVSLRQTPEQLAEYFSAHPEAEAQYKARLTSIDTTQINDLSQTLGDIPQPGQSREGPALPPEQTAKLARINEQYLDKQIDVSPTLRNTQTKLSRVDEYLADEGAILASPDPVKAAKIVANLNDGGTPENPRRNADDGTHPPSAERTARANEVAQKAESLKRLSETSPEALSVDPETKNICIDTAKIKDPEVKAGIERWNKPDENGTVTLNENYSRAAKNYQTDAAAARIAAAGVRTQSGASEPETPANEGRGVQLPEETPRGNLPAAPTPEPGAPTAGGPGESAGKIAETSAEAAEAGSRAATVAKVGGGGVAFAGATIGAYYDVQKIRAGDNTGYGGLVLDGAMATSATASTVEATAPGYISKALGTRWGAAADVMGDVGLPLMLATAGYQIATAKPGEKGEAAYRAAGGTGGAILFSGMGAGMAEGTATAAVVCADIFPPLAAGIVGTLAVQRDIELTKMRQHHESVMESYSVHSDHSTLQTRADQLADTFARASFGDTLAKDANGRVDINSEDNLNKMKAALSPEDLDRIFKDKDGKDKSPQEQKKALQEQLVSVELAVQTRKDLAVPKDAVLHMDANGHVDLHNHDNQELLTTLIKSEKTKNIELSVDNSQVSPYFNLKDGEAKQRLEYTGQEREKYLDTCMTEMNDIKYGVDPNRAVYHKNQRAEIKALEKKAVQDHEVVGNFSYNVERGPNGVEIIAQGDNKLEMNSKDQEWYKSLDAATLDKYYKVGDNTYKIPKVIYKDDGQGHEVPDKLVYYTIHDDDIHKKQQAGPAHAENQTPQPASPDKNLSPEDKARQQALAAVQSSAPVIKYDGDHQQVAYVPPSTQNMGGTSRGMSA